MGVKRASILAVLLLIAACAGTPALTTQERLELYRAHAREPVSSFRYNGHLWGWAALGDGALGLRLLAGAHGRVLDLVVWDPHPLKKVLDGLIDVLCHGSVLSKILACREEAPFDLSFSRMRESTKNRMPDQVRHDNIDQACFIILSRIRSS